MDPVLETFCRRPDGTSLYTAAWGRANAPALLILDGIGCSGWAFRQVIPPLARDFRVVLMHYRGHGRSPTPPRPWHLGIHELADDAEAVMRSIGLSSAVVLGFSMGFQVALELYKRHRDRVRGLVSLAGPSGRVLAQFQGTDAVTHLLPLVRTATRFAEDFSLKVWRKLLPSPALKWIGLQTQLNVDRIDVADLDLYLSQMARMSPELFVEMLHEAARHCSDDLLSRIRVPTLVVAGGRDRFVPLATMRQVAFAIPGASWVVIPEASHALPAEFPEEIAEQVASFARGIEPRAGAVG